MNLEVKIFLKLFY